MLAVRGIFNGLNIQLLEKVEIKANTMVVVTFLEEVNPEYELRDMTSKPSGFQFWENPAEDIYQDYFEKIRNANG
jgi:hypothetical protein